MSTPKVSIVIPCYNVEKFLRQCLDSVVNQTLKDIEIICVDDGSTDSTGEILDSYAAADSRVIVIHKENGGYGKGMNSGLNAACGKYFMVVESDDFIMRDSCEILYNTAEEFQADIVRSDYFDLSTKSGKDTLTVKQMSRDFSYYYRPICPNEELEVYSFVMHNWTGIYNRDFLETHHVRYNETPGASYQDNGFFFQVFSQAKRLVYIPRPCYCYRIDNPASSIHDKSKVYTMSEEYAFIRNFLAAHPQFEQTVLPAYYARLFRAHYQTFKRIDPEFRKQYCELMYADMTAARDAHLLNTGLSTAPEREMLGYLLEGVDTFLLVNSKNCFKKRLFLYRRMVAQSGIKYTLRYIKKRIKI